MKFEKITVGLAVAAFLLACANESVAAPNSSSKKTGSEMKVTLKPIAGKKIAAKAKKKPTVAKKAPTQKKNLKISDLAPRTSALSVKTQTETALVNKKDASESSALKNDFAPAAQISANLNTTLSSPAPAYKGDVGFQIGRDSNIDPEKTSIKGTYFQVAPNLSFENKRWSGAFGASIRDYAEQEKSEIFRSAEAKTSVAYKTKISKMTTSTTALSGVYHDEMWPDYINGPDENGVDHGMPIRYLDVKLAQSLDFDLGNFKTSVGGSALNRNALSLYSDFANEVNEEKLYEKDYNEFSGFGSLTVVAASFLDLTVKPSITQVRYRYREGRQPDGTAGGELNSAPNHELLTSKVDFDIAFKFGESNITPKAFVGQVSDEALGAEDAEFYGVGLSSTLVIDKNTKLALTPNATYKRQAYDNWKNAAIDSSNGGKRLDVETSAGVEVSIMLAKNFKLGAAYSVVREKSNKFADTSENYKQEVASSTLTFLF